MFVIVEFYFLVMFDIFFIISLFIFSLFCFFEVLIFNEEVLLALCFFCFIFFSFNSLGDSVLDIFQSRAAKFESDLLLSFNLTKQSIVKLFDNYFVSRGFSSKFSVLSLTISNYLNSYTTYSSFKLTRLFYSVSLSKLSELVAFESKLVVAFQKKSVSLLLYPLIFQTAKSNISLLTGFSSVTSIDYKITKKNLLVSTLKSIS
jgi:hypothetical protein